MYMNFYCNVITNLIDVSTRDAITIKASRARVTPEADTIRSRVVALGLGLARDLKVVRLR